MASEFWAIPRIWPDSTVYIIGGGPSVAEQDLTLLHDKRVIGVNQAYKLGSWVDVLWFGDKKWYPSQLPAIRKFGGLIITCAQEARMEKRWKRVRYVGRGRQAGLETERRTHIGWNSNSGASAINVAYWLGAKTVVLLGFECSLPENPRDRNARTHWHDDYEPRWDKRRSQLVDVYSRFLRYWPIVKKDADRVGLEILNATPGGALEEFPRVKLEDVT